MDMHKERRPFKVVIVGGGIAGLTLANALEKAPIAVDYVVLEARNTIAPQVGAGIALAPSGCRVLDQLQVYDELARLVHPVESSAVSDSQGRPLLPKRSDTARIVALRMSYPLGWVERRSVLQALYRRLVHADRVLTSKRLDRIDHSRDPGQPITAVCTDGSTYRGDLIVGADGAHSRTRAEMWKAVGEGTCGTGFDVHRERHGEQPIFDPLCG
jgi:2-polyprenyl-6-methoxyphenol hydroxylase-like FAD-dependent oxidoreductase